MGQELYDQTKIHVPEMALEPHASQQGLNGYTDFTGTTSRTGAWFAIQFITDTVFTTLTEPLRDTNSDNIVTGTTFTAGTILYGYFTVIQLTSGSCRAYRIKAK